jgi:hypothetical protein
MCRVENTSLVKKVKNVNEITRGNTVVEGARFVRQYFEMPELSRFFGIIIRMYMEAGVQHNKAHFHAYYQDSVAVYSFEPIELVSGELPKRQQRMVEAWAELHQEELMENWRRLQSGQSPRAIAPLM